MLTPTDLNSRITKVIAVNLNNGFFSIEAVMDAGVNIVLLPKSKRTPTAVQLFSMRANGNSKDESHGKFFTYTKSTKNIMYPSKHLKSYLVEATVK
ncbi:MAG: hypothetical protein GY787_24260 [Alteromonadales bacterium]|nr:hypothetical protein [Alteromonadales bacterium]